MTDPPRPPAAARPPLPAPAAVMLAWTSLALVNASFIARLHGKTAADVRLLHHIYDAGQLLAAGAVMALAVFAWTRLGPRARRAGVGVLAVASVALAWVSARPDLGNFAERVGHAKGAAWVLALSTLVVGLSVPAAALVGARLARLSLRWPAVAVALVAALANDLLLHGDYRGIHLFISLCAATFAAAALTGAAFPARLTFAGGRLVALAAAAAAAILGITTVVTRPFPKVQAELFRIDGAVVTPLVARVRASLERSEAHVPPEMAPWFQRREGLPPIAASSPRLVPSDAIVMLITVDSMRASLFAEDISRKKLPRLDDIRTHHALDFAMARSPASRTVTTWSSVMTGKYYSGLDWHGVSIHGDPTPRFPGLLGEAGVPSVNFVSCSQLGEGNMHAGFTEEITVTARAGQTYATSTEVIPKVIERVERQASGPLFVFAHLMDPHFPYDSVLKTGSNFERFLAEVSEADTQIGALWDAIEAHGLAGRTTLIVAADHGEAFGQHDTQYHTITLYEELLRVPLFVRVPGVAPRRIEDPVSLMDLGPTVLDLFGVATPASSLGQSLVPYLRGQNPKLTRPIAGERVYTRMLIQGSHKALIDSEKGTNEIFDLAADPKETKNLVEDLGSAGQDELATLRAFFEAHGRYGATK